MNNHCYDALVNSVMWHVLGPKKYHLACEWLQHMNWDRYDNIVNDAISALADENSHCRLTDVVQQIQTQVFQAAKSQWLTGLTKEQLEAFRTLFEDGIVKAIHTPYGDSYENFVFGGNEE